MEGSEYPNISPNSRVCATSVSPNKAKPLYCQPRYPEESSNKVILLVRRFPIKDLGCTLASRSSPFRNPARVRPKSNETKIQLLGAGFSGTNAVTCERLRPVVGARPRTF
jgi:hypothetical protein